MSVMNDPIPDLLLYCDETNSGIPFRTQFKLAGTVAMKYGSTASIAFQSLPGYNLNLFSAQYGLTGVSGPSGISTNNAPNGAGTIWVISKTSTYQSCRGNSASRGCVVGALVDTGMNVASLSVPLVAPMTEYGDRINQLDVSITKTVKVGRLSIQPKIDFFNLLNVSPVFAIRSEHFGTPSYNQPSAVLNGRVFQLAAIVRFGR